MRAFVCMYVHACLCAHVCGLTLKYLGARIEERRGWDGRGGGRGREKDRGYARVRTNMHVSTCAQDVWSVLEWESVAMESVCGSEACCGDKLLPQNTRNIP